MAVKFVQVLSLPRAAFPVFRFLYAPTPFEILVVALWLADDTVEHTNVSPMRLSTYFTGLTLGQTKHEIKFK